MLRDPTRDVTTIEVHLRFSTLKPDQEKVMRNVYAFFQTEKGWRAAGITDVIKAARQSDVVTMVPFMNV